MSRLRVAAALVGVTSFVFALTAGSNSATGASTPKSGGTCLRSQSGKVSGSLVCTKSGSTYRWTKRTATKTTARRSTATTAAASPTTTTPSLVDVVSVNFGAAPSSATTTVEMSCTGTFAAGGNELKASTFPSAGGTAQLSLSLMEPSATNPAGSACTAKATVAGATPAALLLLVNGRAQAGPAAAASLTSASFTAWGALAITVIADYPTGTGPAPIISSTTVLGATTLAPTATLAGGSTTTVAGATIPPPASGKIELRNTMIGTVPTSVTGVEFTVFCETPGSPLQSQKVLIPTGQTAVSPITMTTSATTRCQVVATLIGVVDTSSVRARLLWNGQQVQSTTGNFANSPTMPAPTPFTAASEFSFGGATSATTTTTALGATTVPGVSTSIVLGTSTTLASAATTTIASGGAGSITFVPTGNIPATVAGYTVELACTSVSLNGVLQPSVTYTASFSRSAAVAPFNFGFTANSTCTVKVNTNPAIGASGSVSIAVNGTVLGTGAAGTATTSSFSAAAAPQIRVTISY